MKCAKVESKRSFLESLGLPIAVKRKCKVDDHELCVDPCSLFCGEYPYLVDPVDPDKTYDGRFIQCRELVIVPACVRLLWF